MIREGRFGVFEAVTLLFWPILGKIFLSYASGIIKENVSAAWIAVFLGCLAALLWFIPLNALMKRFPGEDLISIGVKSAGPLLGNLLTAVIVIFIFFSAAVTLRQIGETIIGTALPQIPLLVIMIAFAIVMALGAYWGLEATARIAAITTPFLIILLVGLLLMQTGNMNINYLAPLGGPGIPKLALNGFMRSSILSELVLLAFLAPALPRKKTGAAGFYLIALSTLFLTVIMIIGQSIFPPPVAAENTFPFYEIARSVYFGRFYQRVESIFIIIWITITLFSMIVRFYFAVTGMAKIFKMPYYQPLIGMASLGVLGAAFLFPSYTSVVWWDNLIRGRWAWVPAFAIPLLLYLIAVVRGKSKKSSEF
ncbi:MAG TPA: endospore germination permease [Bacillota bacterium]|nr:endospore germination permease [Bacillota bacterium]